MLFVEMILSAALAQLVERRLGKAEVGGSNPLGSFSKELLNIRSSFFVSVSRRKEGSPQMQDPSLLHS